MSKQVLTGMRTTGSLHLGHYVGALKQWLDVQADPNNNCFFLLADVQAYTTHADNPSLIRTSIHEVVLDWLAAGLNPNLGNVHFVLQSAITARSQIYQYLTMIATMGEVERNPTIKEEIRRQKHPTIGFFTYPVDQVADIVMVTPSDATPDQNILVPVGKDQVPHLEYSRELARRFNANYGFVLLECKELVGEVGRLVGTDGNEKMSKSAGNTINLNDADEDIRAKVKVMYTDPNRTSFRDAGTEDGLAKHLPLQYHLALNPNKERAEELVAAYLQGGIKDVEIKNELTEVLIELITPMRERRAEAERNADVVEIVRQGTLDTIPLAEGVLERMRSAMHLDFF